jgi:DNA-binding response OmpR family regulator
MLLGETQDDLAIAMAEHFSRTHFTVQRESNGFTILECLRQNQYDVIILAMALPGLDAIGIVRSYRASGASAPILLTAGRHSSEELQNGLDAGADSYLVKPFLLVDLSAQVRALMRRPRLRNERILTAGDISMDTQAGTVRRNDILVHLHPMEFKLLHFLLRHPNQVFNAHALFERVWQKDAGPSEDTVRTHIRTLRQKIDSTDSQRTIVTVRGLGYKAERG